MPGSGQFLDMASVLLTTIGSRFYLGKTSWRGGSGGNQRRNGNEQDNGQQIGAIVLLQ